MEGGRGKMSESAGALMAIRGGRRINQTDRQTEGRKENQIRQRQKKESDRQENQ